MDAAGVDRRPQAGGALFGCLEQVNAVGRCRDRTRAVQERFGWVKVFVCCCLGCGFFFFPRDLDLHPLVFSGVHPPCNVEMKSTLSWSWSL